VRGPMSSSPTTPSNWRNGCESVTMQQHFPGITCDGACDCGTFFLDVVGEFHPGRVSVNWVDQRRRTHEAVERLIEQAWQKQREKTQAEDKLFDGSLCRLIDCQARDGGLSLSL